MGNFNVELVEKFNKSDIQPKKIVEMLSRHKKIYLIIDLDTKSRAGLEVSYFSKSLLDIAIELSSIKGLSILPIISDTSHNRYKPFLDETKIPYHHLLFKPFNAFQLNRFLLSNLPNKI